MKVITQRSPEWFAIRLGKVTSSRVADVVARTKTGYGASRANYLAQLLVERFTGRVAETYSSGAMQWGSDHEAEARAGYQFRAELEIEEVGFVDHPTIDMSGASPDGLVGADGLVEFKCPNTATHIETLRSGSIPGKYEIQMLWQMACTGRDWCDFVSYDPRLPESLTFFAKRFFRDEGRIADLEREIVPFLAELDEVERELSAIARANMDQDVQASISSWSNGMQQEEVQHAAL